MFEDSFADFIDKRVEAAQKQLAEIVRVLIKEQATSLFDLLDLGSDELFLEPLLFCYLSAKDSEYPLEQILFGYVSGERRPETIEPIR
jgi:hypothetical protein